MAGPRHSCIAAPRPADLEPKPLDPDDPGELATRDGWTAERHRKWDDAFRLAFRRGGGGRYRDDERAASKGRGGKAPKSRARRQASPPPGAENR